MGGAGPGEAVGLVEFGAGEEEHFEDFLSGGVDLDDLGVVGADEIDERIAIGEALGVAHVGGVVVGGIAVLPDQSGGEVVGIELVFDGAGDWGDVAVAVIEEEVVVIAEGGDRVLGAEAIEGVIDERERGAGSAEAPDDFAGVAVDLGDFAEVTGGEDEVVIVIDVDGIHVGEADSGICGGLDGGVDVTDIEEVPGSELEDEFIFGGELLERGAEHAGIGVTVSEVAGHIDTGLGAGAEDEVMAVGEDFEGVVIGFVTVLGFVGAGGVEVLVCGGEAVTGDGLIGLDLEAPSGLLIVPNGIALVIEDHRVGGATEAGIGEEEVIRAGVERGGDDRLGEVTGDGDAGWGYAWSGGLGEWWGWWGIGDGVIGAGERPGDGGPGFGGGVRHGLIDDELELEGGRCAGGGGGEGWGERDGDQFVVVEAVDERVSDGALIGGDAGMAGVVAAGGAVYGDEGGEVEEVLRVDGVEADDDLLGFAAGEFGVGFWGEVGVAELLWGKRVGEVSGDDTGGDLLAVGDFELERVESGGVEVGGGGGGEWGMGGVGGSGVGEGFSGGGVAGPGDTLAIGRGGENRPLPAEFVRVVGVGVIGVGWEGQAVVVDCGGELESCGGGGQLVAGRGGDAGLAGGIGGEFDAEGEVGLPERGVVDFGGEHVGGGEQVGEIREGDIGELELVGAESGGGGRCVGEDGILCGHVMAEDFLSVEVDDRAVVAEEGEVEVGEGLRIIEGECVAEVCGPGVEIGSDGEGVVAVGFTEPERGVALRPGLVVEGGLSPGAVGRRGIIPVMPGAIGLDDLECGVGVFG